MKSSDTQMELVRRYLGGEATLEEARRLESMLAVDAQLRRDYLAYARVEAGLSSKVRPKLVKTASPARWFSWRPLTAAAAGIVFGMFCTSMLFAYVAPTFGKVMTLLQDSFESGPAPEVTGLPREIGKWSGDFTEVVGEQLGVKPPNGKKMLRFLRADYEGKVKPEGSYFSEVYRLVDVRAYRREFGDGGAVAQLSAVFDAFAFPSGESFDCSVSLHALDAETALALRENPNANITRESLAMACSNRARLDRDPKTWQPVSAELRLPPHTDFLLLHLSAVNSRSSQRRITFDGHYLDDVRLTLGRRAPLP